MDGGTFESKRENLTIKRIELAMMSLGILVTLFGGCAENLTLILIGSVIIALSLVLPEPMFNLLRGLGKQSDRR